MSRCLRGSPTVDGHRIRVRWSSRLGGTLVGAAQHLKRYYDPEDLCGEELEMNKRGDRCCGATGGCQPHGV